MAMLFFSIEVSSQIEYKRRVKYAAFKGTTQVTDYIFTEATNFVEHRSWVNKGELYGYVDTNMSAITDFVYTAVSLFQNGFAAISRDSTFGYINLEGKEITKLKYDHVLPFQYGYGRVSKNNNWGLVDSSGREIVSLKYKYPPIVLRSNFIAVCFHNLWGIIDEKGNILYPFIYNAIDINGVAWLNNEKVLIAL